MKLDHIPLVTHIFFCKFYIVRQGHVLVSLWPGNSFGNCLTPCTPQIDGPDPPPSSPPRHLSKLRRRLPCGSGFRKRTEGKMRVQAENTQGGEGRLSPGPASCLQVLVSPGWCHQPGPSLAVSLHRLGFMGSSLPLLQIKAE